MFNKFSNAKSFALVICLTVVLLAQPAAAEFTATGIGNTINVNNTLNGARPGTTQHERPDAPEPQRRQTAAAARKERIANSTSDAKQGIQSILTEMLQLANSNQKPTEDLIEESRIFLKSCRPFLKQLERDTAAEYYLLTAWTDYFNGNSNAAYLASQKANNTDPSNLDAHTSYVAFALMAGKVPSPEIDTDKPLSTNNHLEFNTASIRNELLQRTIPAINTKCLNSTLFSYQPGNTAIAALFWSVPAGSFTQVFDPNTALAPAAAAHNNTANNRPMPNPSEYINDNFRAFTEIYSANFANEQISFIGINTNPTDQLPMVFQKLCTTPSPWPNVMAKLPQSSLQPIADVDANVATLVIADKTGTIIYAGSPNGFVPKMIIESVGGNTLANTLSQNSQNPPQQPNQPAVRPAAPSPDAETSRTPKIKQPRELSMEEKFDAEKRLGMARDLFLPASGKRFITPTQGIEICRAIIKDYPDTEYAAEAQRLLREEVNPRYRERYNLTDEELGL